MGPAFFMHQKPRIFLTGANIGDKFLFYTKDVGKKMLFSLDGNGLVGGVNVLSGRFREL